jgi:hypothetical protein
MRAASIPVVLATFAAAACSHVQPLQAADPAQAISGGAANEAQAEVEGVVVHAAIGGWRGEPKTLEQQLTPVDVTVQNTSRRVIRIGPEAFTLRTPGGPRHALTQSEAAFLLSGLGERRQERFGPRVGAVRGPAFPGYDTPGDPEAPYNRRGTRGAPTPALSQWYATQSPSGMLGPGGRTSIMLFFGTPTHTLPSATFEVALVDDQGTSLGTVRLPFVRD